MYVNLSKGPEFRLIIGNSETVTQVFHLTKEELRDLRNRITNILEEVK